ncbi:T-cell surface glycoprotein CD1a-like [Marmota monax]|uniref:T-cell surface glycoprotein CD1a-like n=1 Tax=Marmota monax TaxID=9995 RepID=UPI0026F2EA89|nr:T-cell surface glycoprotein CD1a-like [Marmota monax]
MISSSSRMKHGHHLQRVKERPRKPAEYSIRAKTTNRVHWLLSDNCPHFTLGLLDAGKTHLQRQAPHSALGWILSAVIVALALLTGLGFWFRKRWTHCEALYSAVPLK